MRTCKIIFGLAVAMLAIFTSCRDQEVNPKSNGLPDIGNDAANIPEWIYENMNYFYFWNDQLPDTKPTGDEDPETYFASLLVDEDRFSYINEDAAALLEEQSGTLMAKGFSTAYGVFTNASSLFAVVEYVYAGSPADEAGLKRGDIILQINGTDLSTTNISGLQANGGFSVTLGEYIGNSIINSHKKIEIGAGTIELDPVIHQEVKDLNGVKVGYLVFIDFIAGDNDVWLISLKNALKSMESQGISELIVDLRYNPGGEVDVAQYLASAIVPADRRANSDVFVTFDYNDNLQSYFTDRHGTDSPNLVKRFESDAGNLNLNRVYFLTTRGTASASELVMNGLKPYMDVIQIGESTYGKFYGSYLLYDENDPPKHNWAIAPIVLKYANADGTTDFVNGLTPDIAIDDDLLNAKPFGDASDPMLATALDLISGTPVTNARLATKKAYRVILDDARIQQKNIELLPAELR